MSKAKIIQFPKKPWDFPVFKTRLQLRQAIEAGEVHE